MASTEKLVVLGMKNSHSLTGLLLITFVIAAVCLRGSNLRFQDLLMMRSDIPLCDFFTGKWVYDNISYPLYKGKECSFMEDGFACEKYGRKDLDYQKWLWQPRDCALPRFNAIALLKKLRGKKLIYVGDSVNKNQFMSMVCLIESSFPESTSKFSLFSEGNSIIFKATDYNVILEFYWSPLLVESNCDNTGSHKKQHCTVRIKAIEKHARYWTDADILVFESFSRWLEPKMTLIWGSFGSSDAIYKEVKMRLRLYEMALSTWSDWLEFHIDRRRTKLFFMSLSPYHNVGEDWGTEAGQNCYGETEPVMNEQHWGSLTDRRMMEIAESAIHKLQKRGVKVHYLNITQLSNYRKDAHPSIYRILWSNLTAEKLANPKSYSDCGHWCLPGVPDVWNTILYSYIMSSW